MTAYRGKLPLGTPEDAHAPPARTKQEVLADMQRRLDALPYWHPDILDLQRLIAILEAEIARNAL